jgi:hypothetical protein
MSAPVKLIDTRDVHIGKRHYCQGDIVEAIHVESLRHAGYALSPFELPKASAEADTDDAGVESNASSLSELPYKELKKLAVERGYDGANGMNAPAMVAYLEGLNDGA